MEAPHHDTLNAIELDRDTGDYMYWTARLTSDDLHSKADIACVLAWYRRRVRTLEAENERLQRFTPELRDGMLQMLIRAPIELDWYDVLYAVNEAAGQMEDCEDLRQEVEMPDGSRLLVNFDAEPRQKNVCQVTALEPQA